MTEAEADDGPPLDPALRVVSWNVRSLRDDARAVAAVVAVLAPAVVTLQEAPRSWGGARALRRLAEASGLRVACRGRRTHGCAVLVDPARVELTAARAHPLPPATPLPWPLGLHRRGTAVAALRVRGSAGGPGWAVVVASAHLGLDEQERVTHAAVLAGLLTGPCAVLGVDANEAAVGAARWRLRADGLVERQGRAPTYPAARPRHAIDVLATGPGLVGRARVPGPSDGVDPALLAAASDHLPLVADLRRVGPPEVRPG